MAFCRLVLPLVLSLICLQSATSSQVPVFLCGDLATTSIKANPLSKVSPQEFDSLLKQELKNDPFTVVFIEETLSVEDLSEKNDDGESSFPFLQANIAKSVYLPSVETPVKALNKLADPEKVDHVKLTENGLSAEIKPEGGRFLFIALKDAKDGESRAELLRRHNNIMEDICGKLQEHNKQVVAIYTAHNPSWTIPEHNRVRRQATANVTSSNSILKLDNLLLYVNQLVLTIGNTSQNLESPSSQTTNLNGSDLVADLVYGDKTVKLFFNENAYGYWFFNKVELTAGTDTEELEPLGEGPVYALKGFAYRCGQAVSFASVNTTREYTLRFNDIKVEAFSNGTAFSEDSFNCVGFFSAPILSALFVVFILLAITFYGIMMMLDIRTMDRFDDPKGKTITINAE